MACVHKELMKRWNEAMFEGAVGVRVFDLLEGIETELNHSGTGYLSRCIYCGAVFRLSIESPDRTKEIV